MEHVNEHIKDLIIGHLCGELDRDGLTELKQWIEASADNARHFNEWQEIWFSSTNETLNSSYDKDNAYRIFRKRVSEARFANRRFYRRWAYVAAAILLFVVVFGAYRIGVSTVNPTLADVIVESPAGSRTKLSLPDGTQVWLNADSKLSYSQGFGIVDRAVKLSGEGYFEVKKKADLPFHVYSKTLHVRVVGTKFNFTDYPNDHEAEVTLTEGKVAVNSMKRQTEVRYLSPNRRAIYNKVSDNMLLEDCKASVDSEWINGVLQFDGRPLANVIKALEHCYRIHISVADQSLYEMRFYGYFRCHEQSLKEILEALSKTEKLHYLIRGNRVILYERKPK